MLALGLLGLPRYPFRMLRALPKAIPNLEDTPFGVFPGAGTLSRVAGALTRDGVERPDLVAPKTKFSGRISPHRRFAFGQLPLTTFKAAKNKHGTTVNDVVVSVCAGAVRRWLIEHDDLPDVPLVAQVPVSVRTGEQFGTYGNRILLMAAPLYTDVPDPVERLRRTHEALAEMKERHRALPAELLQDANNFIPPAVFARAARLTFGFSTSRPGPPDLEPRDLQRARPAVPALHGRRAAGGQLSRVGDHRRHGPQHHGHELHGPHGLRDRRRPRPDARRGRAAGLPARGAGGAEREPENRRDVEEGVTRDLRDRQTYAGYLDLDRSCSTPSTR